MARTKQTSKHSQKQRLPTATFPKKKRKKNHDRFNNLGASSFGNMYAGTYMSNQDLEFLSQTMSLPPMMFEDSDDSDSDNELDTEVYFGTLRGVVVGIRYYSGVVNNKEMVALEREPNNMYDRNAIRVLNVNGEQVGHIKKEIAKALAPIMDNGWARVEGIVPFGAGNIFQMPIDLTLWGQPEKRNDAIVLMKSHGFDLKDSKGGMMEPDQFGNLLGEGSSSFSMSNAAPARRTFLSPDEVKNQMDKLFESLEEGDKTSCADSAEAVHTKMYPHQKQALSWMIKMENGDQLPPFWENRNGLYFNTIANFNTKKRPRSVHGGILADDMGLGKTLQTIALIVTNFKNNKPLAVPVAGKTRKTKVKSISVNTKSNVDQPSTKFKSFADKRKTALKRVKSEKNTSKMLPLPDDFTSSDEDESELLDLKTLLSTEDKDFVPQTSDLKENIPESQPSCRPKRAAKKPVRYDSDSDDFDPDFGSPAKKVKLEKGKTSLKGRAMFKTSKSLPPLPQLPETKSQTPEILNDDELPDILKEEQKDIPKTEIINVDELPDLIHVSEEEMAIPQTDSTADVLPDLSKNKVSTTSCQEIINVEELPDFILVSEEEMDIPKTDSTADVLPELSKNKVSTTSCQETDDGLPAMSEILGISVQESPSSSKYGKTTGRTKCTGPRATLIVCPLSVLSNWLDQLEEHVHPCVHLNVYTYYGSSRTKQVDLLSDQDIVLTTYSTLTADAKKDQNPPLKKVHWLRIVLDEGHVIRNPHAQQTKAIVALKAERKWVLTGTPIQNSMKDLWSIINFLQIAPFTDRHWWHRTIERPLTSGDESAIKRVQHLMRHIALRRTKQQKMANNKPIVELPERNVYVEHVTFSEDERKVYDAMQNEGKLVISRYFRQGTLLHNYGQVLAILMRLRQLCCHPLLVAKAAAMAKVTLDAVESNAGNTDLDEEAKDKLIQTLLTVLNSGSDEECSVCLDGLKFPVITRCAHVYCRGCIEAVIKTERPDARCPLCRGKIGFDTLLEVPPPQEDKEDDVCTVSEDEWQSSAKVDALMNALLQLRHEDPTIKSLIVSQFTSLLSVLEVPLSAKGFKFVRFDGAMNSKKRSQAIEEFSDRSIGSPTIMLLSLKAGGVGINLTAASRVFLMDPAWNPASEEQCFDRCHRLGQTRDVTVIKFIVENSVEERMMELQEKKRKLMQGAFGKKVSPEERRQNRIRDIRTLMNF